MPKSTKEAERSLQNLKTFGSVPTQQILVVNFVR